MTRENGKCAEQGRHTLHLDSKNRPSEGMLAGSFVPIFVAHCSQFADRSLGHVWTEDNKNTPPPKWDLSYLHV